MSSHEPFDELEAELRALGAVLDVPPPPPAQDVTAAVRTRLEPPPDAAPQPAPDVAPQPTPYAAPPPVPVAPRTPPGRTRGRRGNRGRRWAVVAAVVVAVVAATAATPQGRAAVTAILRFAGIELHVGDTPPPPVATTAPLPGERTLSPSETPGVTFPVRTPSRLGPPDRTTVADGGRLVSMFWPDGIRLDQFDGAMDPYFFKQLGPPFPDFVRVGGRDAIWLTGAHPLGYLEREDGTRVPLRQAGPTLIWQAGGVNHRLEGARTAREAAEIAESLR
ncbi:MAG TPA: hypothetical protein VFV66_05475 [Nonomuraea sp.]|nr:hypothetical protein [Nonomuraea sp.]